MKHLTDKNIERIIDCLKSGKEIPEHYGPVLFPTIHSETELKYANKMLSSRVLGDNEQSKPVPLQVLKVFNSTNSRNEQNLLVFGDNLQVLKAIYQNDDPVIGNEVKGKIKLVYIDSPFGTGDQYSGNKGQSAYSAKKKDSEFIEFLRKRLILVKDVLADDGSVYLRIDYRFGHYIKIVMDEIFGKHNFRNQIIVNKSARPKAKISQLHSEHDFLLFYTKSNNYTFRAPEMEKSTRNYQQMHLNGIRWSEVKQEYLHLFSKENLKESRGKIKSRARIILGKEMLPPGERHWAESQDTIFEREKRKEIKMDDNGNPKALESETKKIGDIWTDIPGYSATQGYPTENSEELLQRIIETSTDEGDLVLDIFAGSGTTLAVADKLGRRWIGCDIGKLSTYITQRRLLNLSTSKCLKSKKKIHGREAKPFAIATSGLYDIEKIFNLDEEDYLDFVKNLFEVSKSERDSIAGIQIDGKKGGAYVKIFPYWKYKDAGVDESYVEQIHKNLSGKIGQKFYIIAPDCKVDFINDYHPIDSTRYYFLRVPYQVIKDLNEINFKKIKQAQSKKHLNDLDEMIGFHFIDAPEVESSINESGDKLVLEIKKFQASNGNEKEKFYGFSGLAMVLVDLNYNNETFIMSECFFASDFIGKDVKTKLAIMDKLSKKKKIKMEFDEIVCGKFIMVIYVDIYGNEFKEKLVNRWFDESG